MANSFGCTGIIVLMSILPLIFVGASYECDPKRNYESPTWVMRVIQLQLCVGFFCLFTAAVLE